MTAEAQKRFSFVKNLPKKKAERVERIPPLGIKTAGGITFKLLKEYDVVCGDCGAQTMVYCLIYQGRRFIGRRNVCINSGCLYKTAQQFQV